MRGKRSSGYGTAKYSADGIWSLILGLVGWILFGICVITTILHAGNAPVMFGYLFIVASVCAVWGFVFSLFFWNAEEGTLGFKRLLVLLNGILVIISACLIGNHLF